MASPMTVATNSSIVSTYQERTPGSAQLAAEAKTLFPSGVTHDARYLRPYGIYVTHAKGAHKWDVDGNRYVDYFGGHGALLLGHNHPEVAEAMHNALDQGTHFAANHEAEIRWARAVQRLMPAAERVRFTSSGTEATLMALRLARAFTGKERIVRFKGHFHGWHDDMTTGYQSHFDGTPTSGVAAEVARNTVLAEGGDTDGVEAILAERNDIAAVIIETMGPGTGRSPIEPSFLFALRELTERHGVILIFDEVVTGFRASPGGVQAKYGIAPDLTALAKILAGGLPGGAVAGRKDLLDWLDFDETGRDGREKIFHPGTYNANPLSAAAGTAALGVIASSDACERADTTTAALRAELVGVLEEQKVPWGVYGESSAFHIFTNPRQLPLVPREFRASDHSREELKETPPALLHKLRVAMLANGVDISGSPGGLVSAVHGDEDVAYTAEAFRESLRMLKRDGEI